MKTYLIIGASSGIGRQIKDDLLAAGNIVYGTYNSGEIAGDHPNLKTFQLNVLEDTPDISWLPDVVDGLVYCPGSINLKPFSRIKPGEYLDDYGLNVVGAGKVIQAALPALKAAANPGIVLFSTVAVSQGFPFHAQVSASKGAVEGLVRALAAEFAPSIRVNCIAPSLTNTPLASRMLNTAEKLESHGNRHPLQRVGEASDLAGMAIFLLGDTASWMTGQVLHHDGGMSSIRG